MPKKTKNTNGNSKTSVRFREHRSRIQEHLARLEKHRKKIDRYTPTDPPAEGIDYSYFFDMEPFSLRTYFYKIYRPQNCTGSELPTLIYYPGDGYITYERYSDWICRHMAALTGCQVIQVLTKKAPEFPFPVAAHDAFYGLKYLLQRHKAFKIDRQRVSVSGYSSGGNLAALTVMRARSENLHVTHQILISPVTDLSFTLARSGPQTSDKTMTHEFAEWFSTLYIPERVDRRDASLSPYWASQTAFASLPSTDILYGECDYFREDSRGFAAKMAQHLPPGKRVNEVVFPKENHGLMWTNRDVLRAFAEKVSIALRSPMTMLHYQLAVNIPRSVKLAILAMFSMPQSRKKPTKDKRTDRVQVKLVQRVRMLSDSESDAISTDKKNRHLLALYQAKQVVKQPTGYITAASGLQPTPQKSRPQRQEFLARRI